MRKKLAALILAAAVAASLTACTGQDDATLQAERACASHGAVVGFNYSDWSERWTATCGDGIIETGGG